MRQVDTCDFCGDEAAGLFEPLPASIPDAPRLLLCSGCRDRLGSVVDPLLARFGDELTESPGAAGGAADREQGREPPGAERRAPDGFGAAPAGPTGGPDPAASDPADGSGVGESRDASGREKRDRGGTPPGYRKVMRFLENREFPVERSEAELLATDAYDLDEGTVVAAIDHAVQYGRLREVDGALKR